MRITLVSPYYDSSVADPNTMLRRFPILRELPVEVARLGHDVSVVLLSPVNARIHDDTVVWRFVTPSRGVRLVGKALHRWKPRYGPAYYQSSLRLVQAIRATRPDVIHVFGLTMDLHLAFIMRLVNAPIVAHYHGGLPAIGRLQLIQRHNLARLTRALFTTQEQAEPWIAPDLLSASQVETVLETSSPFSGIPQVAARTMTGMFGNPVYLSAGRLHPIKDPMTMLRGFASIAVRQPEARLYLHYLTDELLPEIHALLDDNPALRDRVELRGRAAPDAMEAIYSSADFLLQASLREWSGLAVLEAMSCGCIPIVTDIPSFAKMTDNGRFGGVFAVCDAQALATAALGVHPDRRDELAREVQAHFRSSLSFAAIARRLDAIYHDINAT